MTDMIERIGAAIAVSLSHEDAETVWVCTDENTRDRYRAFAKAALSALEDPSEEMVEAGKQTISLMLMDGYHRNHGRRA